MRKQAYIHVQTCADMYVLMQRPEARVEIDVAEDILEHVADRKRRLHLTRGRRNPPRSELTRGSLGMTPHRVASQSSDTVDLIGGERVLVPHA